VGWWRFDECQGTTAYDASGNGNNGSINIGATAPQTSAGTCTDGLSTSAWYNGATGKYNASLNFDGVDDYVSIADTTDSVLDITNEITLSAWVKLDAVDNNDRIILKPYSSTSWTSPYAYYELYVMSDRTPRFGLSINSAYTSVSSSTPVSLNTWNHIVATYNGSQMKIYLNGKEIASKNQTGSINTNNEPVYIGTRTPVGNEAIDGQIDDVRIYNYALTAEQVKALYNEGSAVRFGPSSGSP
jgi:hypothetical protein